jgi:hypothetical protein
MKTAPEKKKLLYLKKSYFTLGTMTAAVQHRDEKRLRAGREEAEEVVMRGEEEAEEEAEEEEAEGEVIRGTQSCRGCRVWLPQQIMCNVFRNK